MISGMRHGVIVLAVGLTLLFAASAQLDAQTAARESATQGDGVEQTTSLDLNNPISVLKNASRGLDALQGATPGQLQQANAAAAGDSTPDQRSGDVADQSLSTTLSIIFLLTLLTLAPSLLIMCTSFTRIVVVLALLRQAIGTQSLPPSQVVIGLSVFVTLLVMAPTFERINREAIVPLTNNEINEYVAWERAKQPLRDFMFDQIEYADNWGDVYMILNYRGVDTSEPDRLTRADVDMLTLIPAFILSELKIAFLMGFRLYLPFLIIDMVIASVLISMGMLMLPPVLISLPFKLLLFVMVDGWRLVVGNLLDSFAVVSATGVG